MQGQLLVTPEEMRNTAERLEDVRYEIETLLKMMLEEARNLTSVWEGDASEAYVNKFNLLEDDMIKMYNMVTEHINDLRDMAGIYENAERINEMEANALADDVIN